MRSRRINIRRRVHHVTTKTIVVNGHHVEVPLDAPPGYGYEVLALPEPEPAPKRCRRRHPIPTSIEHGIPCRPPRRRESYPFSKMEINDSFLIPATSDHPKPWLSRRYVVGAAMQRFKRKGLPNKFVSRKVAKGTQYSNGYVEPANGMRVFRIA